MSHLAANDLKTRGIAAGRVIKESVEAHVARLDSLA